MGNLERLTELYESIYNPKTKEYFKEVLSSYNVKNYRSAVVMLYTVTICDLVYKLTDLKDIHNDSKAIRIIDDLNVERQLHPVSSQWENNLIEKAFSEAHILENDVYTHILTLKSYRNLCAHPALTSLELLYNPTSELVYTLMINILEGLLTQHPLLTKNVFMPFMSEIERIKEEFPTVERLEQYLHSKYFIHFNIELTKYIFKHLWKLVFNNVGSKETTNRDINYKVLLIIYKNNESDLFVDIRENSEHFSQIKDDNSKIVEKYIDFLSIYPDIYQHLSEHTKEILRIRVSSSVPLFIKSYFVSENVVEHLKRIDIKIHTMGGYFNQPYEQNYPMKTNEIDFLEKICREQNCLKEFYDLMISHYYHSGSYHAADFMFIRCIEDYFKNFSKEQFETLFKEAVYNPQCSGRRESKYEHRKLIEAAKKVGIVDVETKYATLF